MVYQDQNRIVTINDRGEIGDEIHRSIREKRSIIGGRHRHEGGASGMSINLERLTFKATCNVVVDKGSEARPVIFL